MWGALVLRIPLGAGNLTIIGVYGPERMRKIGLNPVLLDYRTLVLNSEDGCKAFLVACVCVPVHVCGLGFRV